LQAGRKERNEDNEKGYEPRFQGFLGEDTRGNIVFFSPLSLPLVRIVGMQENQSSQKTEPGKLATSESGDSGEDPRANGGLVSNLPHPRVNKTKQHTIASG